MKTSEFIEKVKALEFVGGIEKKRYERFREYKNCLTVVSENNTVIAAVSTDVEFLVGTRFYTFYSLNVEQRKQLFDLLTEYAATPISERRDKTIEEKAREYMKECMNDNLNFYSCVDNLLFNAGNDRESEIYLYYQTNSNEFVKLWCEVAADEH